MSAVHNEVASVEQATQASEERECGVVKILLYEPKHILTIAGRCVSDCPACLVRRAP